MIYDFYNLLSENVLREQVIVGVSVTLALPRLRKEVVDLKVSLWLPGVVAQLK